MSSKNNKNKIVDRRNERKTIHISVRKKRRLKKSVANILLISLIMLLSFIIGFLVFKIIKEKTGDIDENNNQTEKDITESLNSLSNDLINENAASENVTTDNQYDEDNESIVEQEEFTKEELIIAENEFIYNIGPTECSLNWDGYENETYKICYMKINAEVETHGINSREDKSMDMELICSAYDESSENLYLSRNISGNKAVITGLSPSTEYEFMVLDSNDDLVSENSIMTSSSGYCDPFKAIEGLLIISSRDESTGQIIESLDSRTVIMSSESGCLGTEAKPVLKASYYKEADLNNEIGSFQVGTDLYITEDQNGNYCYLMEDGNYRVYVKDDLGNEGWVNARRLMVDVKQMFSPENGLYGIMINRTNAYSSIFTAGGDVMQLDDNEDVVSRYNALSSNVPSEFMTVTGTNTIANITGTALPNYGSKDKMPVVWDLALELIQCQKNALENGYCLLMYDGYRPSSASLLVEQELSSQGYLSTVCNGTNLAQGFLTDQSYSVSFYIAKHSRHNKGIATDITLVKYNSSDEIGEEVKMQSKIHTLDFRCNMAYNNWQADLLSDIMMGHGSHLECLAVRSEWWHFQLKTNMTDLYPLIKEYTYMDFVF